jgi:hypothetical protein
MKRTNPTLALAKLTGKADDELQTLVQMCMALTGREPTSKELAEAAVMLAQAPDPPSRKPRH